MVRFFAAGNPALPDDSLAIRLAALLPEFSFEPLDDPLILLELKEPAVILDAATGISEVRWIDAGDSASLSRERQMVSLHDFDLQAVLSFGNALGQLPRIRILAVPMALTPEQALPDVRKALRPFATSSQKR